MTVTNHHDLSLRPRIAFVGPMGIGKTTAIRTLCRDMMVSSDVPNLDKRASTKEFTTVGAEFGQIDVGEDVVVQVCGCPGQGRFDFLRHWVLSISLGIFVMVDANAVDALESTCDMLKEIAAMPHSPLVLILSARPASTTTLDSLSAGLACSGHGVIPIIALDVRRRDEVLSAVAVFVSMLYLRSQQQ